MNGSPSPNPLWQSPGPSVDVAKSSKGDEFDSQYDEQLAVLLTSLADRIQKGERSTGIRMQSASCHRR